MSDLIAHQKRAALSGTTEIKLLPPPGGDKPRLKQATGPPAPVPIEGGNIPCLKQANGPPVPIEGSLTIGRSSKNTLALDEDMGVSARHAMIQQQDGGDYWLHDLVSRNGTHRNGVRVKHPVRLHHGDKIQIVSYSFEFVHEGQEVSTLTTNRGFANNESTIARVAEVASWLLVSDVEGFSKLSNTLPADELGKTLDAWLLNSKRVVEAHQGQINKFLGDGYFAYWKESDAAMAQKVLGALDALERVQTESYFRFRVVLHHGVVHAGGAGALHEEGLLGKEVNFVFRMEKLAGALGRRILMSESAARLLDPLKPTATVGKHEVKDFPGAHEFFTFRDDAG